jgi:membrane-associated phospholipid phosphatase
MQSTVRAPVRRTNSLLRIFRPSSPDGARTFNWSALANGAVVAAGFAGVLFFIAESIDVRTARVAGGVDPAISRVLRGFSEIGSSGWILCASAAIGVVAILGARRASRVRDRAGLTVLATRAGFLFLVTVLSVCVVQAIKFVIGRAHPHLLAHYDAFRFHMFSPDALAASFPSGHATTAFAVAAAMALFIPRWQTVFFLLALAVCVARVATGLHFPSDVLGGMVLGMALTFALARYFARRKLVFQLVDGKLVRRGEHFVRRALKSAFENGL